MKDNLCTNKLDTTCASNVLRGKRVLLRSTFCDRILVQIEISMLRTQTLEFVTPYEATVVSRLREYGGIIIGKTNMDEFGMG